MPLSPALVSASPTRKVRGATGGATVGGALTSLILWLLDDKVYTAKHEGVPIQLQDALIILIPAVLAFIGGYLPRHDQQDLQVEPV